MITNDCFKSNFLKRRRQRRADGGAAVARQPLRAQRHHLVGHRLRGAQPARRLHAHLRVPRLDQPDLTVLVERRYRTYYKKHISFMF